MYTFAVKVRFFDEFKGEMVTRCFFTRADHIPEAYEMAFDFYGEENIDFISIEGFDAILDFDEETFDKIRREGLENK